MPTVDSEIYKAIISYCELLERDEKYIGNGHHLAQKLSALVEPTVIRLIQREVKRAIQETKLASAKQVRPVIVCLCGSTRFAEAFVKANFEETTAGRIVLSVGCFMHADGVSISEVQKKKLDELHKRKIDIADEILVLNVNGYIGESTRSEIEYAQALGKKIRWLEEPKEESNV